MVKVAQCWDDGVLNDIKLTELLRKYNAKATFNLNPALHSAKVRQTTGWMYKDYCPGKLAWNEVTAVYEGFDVASHTMCHCSAGVTDDKVFFLEALDARKVIENLFQKEATGFAWPCGKYTQETADMLLEAGFTYGRTTGYTDRVSGFTHPMILHSSSHFMAPDFWERFEKAKTTDGIFYFWGHSYEMMDEKVLWNAFEDKLRRLSNECEIEWIPTVELVKK